MKKKLLLATTCFLSATALAEDINTLPKDTTKVIDIEAVSYTHLTLPTTSRV